MNNFTRKRLAAGLTKAELAGKLGVTPRAVGRWEAGETLPEPRFFPPLADIFGITPEEVTHLLVPAPDDPVVPEKVSA